jgi:SpoVK/Ycf46/Vps4 family AAA+-type ATPase
MYLRDSEIYLHFFTVRSPARYGLSYIFFIIVFYYFYKAIHPLVRLGLKAPFPSKRSFLIFKHLVSPLEAAKCSRNISDQMYSGQGILRLIPVRVSFELSQYSPFRRTPCSESDNHVDVTVRERLLTAPTASGPRLVAPDFPVNIGEIVFVPDDDCLYRVDLEWNVNENVPPPDAASFAFNQKLLEWIAHSLDASRHCCIREVQNVCIKDLVFRGTISRLLRTESVFPSNLHGFLQPALEFCNTLVFGDHGCGKTHLALTIAAATRIKAGYNVVFLSCRQLRDTFTIRMKAVLTELSKAFDDALDAAPCLLILDDLDELTPSFGLDGPSSGSAQLHDVNSAEIEQSKLIADFVLDKISSTKGRVAVLATSQTAESLSEQLLLDGSFSHRIVVPALEDSEREVLYRLFLRQLNPLAEGRWQGSFDIARKTRGFRPRDIERLAFQVNKLWQSEPNIMSMKRATSIVLQGFVPLAHLRSSSDTREVSSNLKWCHLGGMHREKLELISTIVRPSLYRRIYDRARIKLPRGVLLFGYPGTGKSICVPALAHECGFPLIMCRGPEILDKYIGASEAKVRALFSQAAACAPSILFFDELDSLAPRRGSDSSGVTDRVVNQLLTFLDGVDVSTSASQGPVYVIAATSRPDKIDPALLRPGRLEKHIFFGLSEEIEEVSDLLQKISDLFSLDSEAKKGVVSGDLVRAVSAESPDIFRLFSAADFTAVFCTAQLMAARKALALGRTNDTACISYDNLVEALISARPSLSVVEYQFLSDIYNVYRLDMMPSSTVNRPVKSLNTALR